MPLAQLADPWQKMPVGGTPGEDVHHDPEDSVGEDDSAPACTGRLVWGEWGSPGHLMGTLGGRLQLHVSGAEAKPVCISAITSLVRGLRRRLKAFRRLLLTRSDASPPQPAVYPGQTKPIDRKTGELVSGCCGSTQPRTSVSSPGGDSFPACLSDISVVRAFGSVLTSGGPESPSSWLWWGRSGCHPG
ncbi:unnamed protein product [Tetraodon nigroviridis]|uniref:(spotted green pufferfish) hypothetical protein n=1 Tax=Tetraodon nigroviridis TaxID=99883 RepID=Q4T3C1_TETNG|nr:unnamed protein product [Tetraodon nigroviridis]